jgi:nucleoid DNA-binding protein
MKVVQAIQTLLRQHDYVIIPGFGGFIVKPRPARIHFTKHLFSPPTKKLAFNQRLQEDDGLLVNYLARESDKSQKEAEQQAKQFVKELKEELEAKQLVRLSKIGKFYYDADQNLQFSPDRSVNFNLDSYGLPEFQFYPVSRKTAREKKKDAKQRSKSTSKKKATTAASQESGNTKLVATLTSIAAFLLLLLAVQLFWPEQVRDSLHKVKSSIWPASDTVHPSTSTVTDTSQQKVTYADEDTFNASSAANNEQTDTTASQEAESATQPQDTAKETSADTEKSPRKTTATPTSGYYIIVGSFQQRDNAEQFAAQLKRQGRSVQILQADNGFHRVGIGQYSEDEAMDQLPQLRQQVHANAWVHNRTQS